MIITAKKAGFKTHQGATGRSWRACYMYEAALRDKKGGTYVTRPLGYPIPTTEQGNRPEPSLERLMAM